MTTYRSVFQAEPFIHHRRGLLSSEDIVAWQKGGSRGYPNKEAENPVSPNIPRLYEARDHSCLTTCSTKSRPPSDASATASYSTCSSNNSACASVPYHSACSTNSDGVFQSCEEPDSPKVVSHKLSEDLGFERYSDDIYKYRKATELKYHPVNCLKDQTQITINSRTILVDWLTKVCKLYGYGTETMFLAVNMIDRFLEAVPITKDCLQLLGVSALFIACKKIDVCPVYISELVDLCAGAYSRQHIRKMEQAILIQLKFSLCVTTSYYFLEYYLMERTKNRTLNSHDRALRNYSTHLLELSVQSYNVSQNRPSLLAVSAIRLAEMNMANSYNMTFNVPAVHQQNSYHYRGNGNRGRGYGRGNNGSRYHWRKGLGVQPSSYSRGMGVSGHNGVRVNRANRAPFYDNRGYCHNEIGICMSEMNGLSMQQSH